jgi:hypothetical protein
VAVPRRYLGQWVSGRVNSMATPKSKLFINKNNDRVYDFKNV